MSKDNKGDIYGELDCLPITLFSNKLKVLIIGGGKAAFIKCKGLYNHCKSIHIVSKEFIEDFYKFNGEVSIIEDTYSENLIIDKHLIIIAIDDKEEVENIINHCEKHNKIYINSTSFKNGMGLLPVKVESENITVAVNTKVGNPKGSLLISEYISDVVKSLDGFIKFTSIIRNNLIIDKEEKNSLLKFINSRDFKFFYEKDRWLHILKLFYNEDIIDKIVHLNLEENIDGVNTSN